MNPLLKQLQSQLARPHGLFSRLIAPLMERANHTINGHVVAALGLTPGQRVLEIGFGGGIGLATVLARQPALALAGVDPSPEMVAHCQRRFGNKVDVRLGGAEQLAWPDGSFDRVYGVNVSYFWPDLARALAELRRVLAPGGLLVLGIRPPETLRRLKFEQAGHRVWAPEQYVEALRAAGFSEVGARELPDDSGGTYVLTASAY